MRDSAKVLEQQNASAEKKTDGVLTNLSQIKDIGIEICDAIIRGNLHRFGQLLDVHWEVKKRLSRGVSNPQIDSWYQLARRNGAIGGKISGAGGGGFFMLCVPSDKRQAVRQALSDLREMPFRLERGGSRVILNVQRY